MTPSATPHEAANAFVAILILTLIGLTILVMAGFWLFGRVAEHFGWFIEDEEPPQPLQQGEGVGTPAVPTSLTPCSAASPTPPSTGWIEHLSSRPDNVPHVAILGPSGSGKSTLMEALAGHRDGQIVIIQPNRRAGEWAGVQVIECDDDGGYGAILSALEQIRAEFTRRGGAMKRGDPGPWLTVIWDEVPLCIGKLGKPAREMMVDLLSAGRPRKIRLIAGSTSDRVGALGIEGYGDLLESCAVVRLGSFAVNAAPTTAGSVQPTTLEIGGQVQVVERGPTLAMPRQHINPARVWAAPTTASERHIDPAAHPTTTTSLMPVGAAQEGETGAAGVVVVGKATIEEQVAIIREALQIKLEGNDISRSEVCRRVFNGSSGGGSYNKVRAVLDSAGL